MRPRGSEKLSNLPTVAQEKSGFSSRAEFIVRTILENISLLLICTNIFSGWEGSFLLSTPILWLKENKNFATQTSVSSARLKPHCHHFLAGLCVGGLMGTRGPGISGHGLSQHALPPASLLWHGGTVYSSRGPFPTCQETLSTDHPLGYWPMPGGAAAG